MDVRLTPRQLEIIELIAEDMTSKEIALVIGISLKTVEVTRAQAYDRLGVKTSGGAVAKAFKLKLIRL